MSINLSGNKLCGVWTDNCGGQHGTNTAEGITAIADAMRVNGALTVTNLLGNKLDAESAKMLAEVAKQKGISLCGIRRDQTTADFSNMGINLPDVILLASDLSQAVVTGGLTKLWLAENKLGEEGTKFLCDALVGNNTLKELDLSGDCTYVGTGSNIGGTAGAKHVANMLLVNGGLTVANLLRNQLDAESAKMLAEVAKQKGISLCGIQRDQTTADFSNQYLKPPDAILLASDLSQEVVAGALTKVR
jgi:Ran GTPase-activating protein (RanGAP) involved in mRNA processing and transport